MSANAWLGATAGALGGIAGSWAMVRFNHAVGGRDGEGGSHAHRRRHATPNDTDATISDEPATDQVASRAAEAVLGRPLDEREQQQVAPLFHYAFGALCGAIYGAVAERQRAATAGAGAPFGAVVWLAADEVGLPAAGLARNPTTYPLSRHAAALGSHLVFGLTVEGVRRLLRGSSRRETERPSRPPAGDVSDAEPSPSRKRYSPDR